ncbi:DUF6630 family protein [Nocardia sp. R16R-3T]
MDRSRLITIAERLASDEPSLATAVRSAVDDYQACMQLYEGLRDADLVGYIDAADDPEPARETLESLKFCPPAMSWKWWEDHRDDIDEDEDIERFLGLAGEHSQQHGVLLVQFRLDADAWLLGFFRPDVVHELIGDGSLRVVRRGWEDQD